MTNRIRFREPRDPARLEGQDSWEMLPPNRGCILRISSNDAMTLRSLHDSQQWVVGRHAFHVRCPGMAIWSLGRYRQN